MKIPRVSVVLKNKSLLGCILTLKSLSPRSPRDDADVEPEPELLTPEAATMRRSTFGTAVCRGNI